MAFSHTAPNPTKCQKDVGRGVMGGDQRTHPPRMRMMMGGGVRGEPCLWRMDGHEVRCVIA